MISFGNAEAPVFRRVLVVGLHGVCIVTPLRVGWQPSSNVVPCAFY